MTAFEVAKAHNQKAVCDLLEKHGSKTTEKEITQVYIGAILNSIQIVDVNAIPQEQKERVKTTSRRLGVIFDFLERTLLRVRVEKREQKQSNKGETSSNIFQRRREKQLAKKMKGATIHTDTTTKVTS